MATPRTCPTCGTSTPETVCPVDGTVLGDILQALAEDVDILEQLNKETTDYVAPFIAAAVETPFVESAPPVAKKRGRKS